MNTPVTIITTGRVTADLELKTSQNGKNTKYVQFGLAVNKGYGEKEHPNFYNCLLYGEDAQRIIDARVKKGSLIQIIGDQELVEYNRKDGSPGWMAKVTLLSWNYAPTNRPKEEAYRIKERRYLEEDFANALADTAQNPDTRFHSGHLEEFPELTDWLCECFDHFYDANISHNDLMELTVNHLHHACLTPEFFTRLALKAPAFCKGLEKLPQDCEKNCSRYYRCSDITMADERSKRWETLSSLLAIHIHGGCTCSEGSDEAQCPAAKYLHGEWDISEFFHSEERQEAI